MSTILQFPWFGAFSLLLRNRLAETLAKSGLCRISRLKKRFILAAGLFGLALLMGNFYLSLQPAQFQEVTPGVEGMTVKFKDRHVVISDGVVAAFPGRIVTLRRASFDIPFCPVKTFESEPFQLVKPIEEGEVYPELAPRGLRVGGAVLGDALIGESVRLESLERPSATAHLSSDDFKVDARLGMILAPDKAMRAVENVRVDYAVKQRCLYVVAADRAGNLHLFAGPLSVGPFEPPSLPDGLTAVLDILAPPSSRPLSKGDFRSVATSIHYRTASF